MAHTPLENLTFVQLLNKFHTIYVTWRFIIVSHINPVHLLPLCLFKTHLNNVDINTPVKLKDKVHLRTGHEGPEGESYSSSLSLTSALEGGAWTMPRTGRFILGKDTRYPFIGDWVGSRAGLEGSENLAPTGIRSPESIARSDSLYRLR